MRRGCFWVLPAFVAGMWGEIRERLGVVCCRCFVVWAGVVFGSAWLGVVGGGARGVDFRGLLPGCKGKKSALGDGGFAALAGFFIFVPVVYCSAGGWLSGGLVCASCCLMILLMMRCIRHQRTMFTARRIVTSMRGTSKMSRRIKKAATPSMVARIVRSRMPVRRSLW